MKLAFCLFKYFPHGGLQREFMRVAQLCQQRGHTIDVYTMAWQGEIPKEFNINIIPAKGFTNHQRACSFAKKLQPYLEKNYYHQIIGFNRMPLLDIYFAADPCFQALAKNEKGFWYRFTPRYRHYLQLEKSIFAAGAKTKILVLTETQKRHFIKYYSTPSERFHMLTPTISKSFQNTKVASETRKQIRESLGIKKHQQFLLMVGSHFKTKGVDRTLHALSSLPHELLNNIKLYIAGKGAPNPFLQLAKKLKIANHVQFLGPRDDVPYLMRTADLLLHPSYHETAGNVLLEAISSGLPILVSANCGYAYHIERAQAGLLISNPFQQTQMNAHLKYMLESDKTKWQENGINYATKQGFFSGSNLVVDLIEGKL